ncbi:MAG: arylsulfatase [Verrucomicrobiales bacterium]|nr:arylsulfatase [Verrucomicrobiales bacterium]
MTHLFFRFIFCLTVGFSASLTQAEKSQPNIILILADDMGVGEMSHAGGLVPTPALDQMAKEGMSFTDAHTSSSVCTPTRYGILTGRYNWRSRLKRGVLTNVDSAALMDPERLSVSQFLKEAGYDTAMFGKWHLGVDWVPAPEPEEKKGAKNFGSWKVDYTKPFRNGPIDMGFDEAHFILSSLDMPPYLYLRGDRAVEVPTVDRGFPHNEYNDYQRVGAASATFEPSECLADWAEASRNYIRERAEGESGDPFFLYLPLNSPHTPCVPGKAFKGKYPQYSWYADFVAETDWVVGEVLAQLAESGVDENTLVIFTADNGFAPYVEIPKMFADGYQPSGDFRGAKATLFEGGHRVPFLVRWPAQVEAGTESEVTICTTDFFATFADVIGNLDAIPDEAAEDSFSFYPAMKGEADEVRPFTVHHSIGGEFAIREGPWKLLLTNKIKGGWGGMPGQEPIETPVENVQLYHLGDDPGETKNLETTHPEKIEELVNLLAKAMADGRTTPGEVQENEGWPMVQKEMIQLFPQLGEPE